MRCFILGLALVSLTILGCGGGEEASITIPQDSGGATYTEESYEPAPSQRSAASRYSDYDLSTPMTMPLPSRLTEELPAAEEYDHIVENGFKVSRQDPLSTFSIDVDTASYANVRRFLSQNQTPPAGAVRIEEMINYFNYNYEPPTDNHPFAVHVETGPCPWDQSHQLARIGLKGRELQGRPAANLVFLLDVSGSMSDARKLPLVKAAMRMLVNQMNGDDRIAIAVYAGSAGLALPSTSGDNTGQILQAIERLEAGGSTNGGQGIELAYRTAVDNFVPNGINRVILCTDGDFNVGVANRSDLIDLIETQAKSDVFLSVLGFGTGNYKDATMEQLADCGNGNYAYIDRESEARKVLVEQMSGTLVTIARDVKIQVDFNPARIAGYRLVGYENRMLSKEDFRDDQKDAGEIGAGHTVTALYEIVPAGHVVPTGSVEPSKYQDTPDLSVQSSSDELMTVRLRYKEPDTDDSTEFHVPVDRDPHSELTETSNDFRVASAVAAFGMHLRKSENSGSITLPQIKELAESGVGKDARGWRTEFCRLLMRAESLASR